MLSWTGVPSGDVRMRFRGETFGSRALRNPVMRGCPRCLAEDAARLPDEPLAVMVMRGEWQLRDAGICLRHESPLTELWSVTRLDHRLDLGSRLDEIREALLSGSFDQACLEPAPYDIWLDARLENGFDPTWLNGIPLYAATTISGLLGAELVAAECDTTVSPAHRHRLALVKGFDALKDGEDAFRGVLDWLAARANGFLDEPGKAFGNLFWKLSRDFLDDDAFAPFREILRTCILSHWPYAAGDVLLGEPVKERHLHSIVTAARETGISAFNLDAMLTEAGAFAFEDGRPHSRKTFIARDFAALLEEIPTRIGPGEMRAAMGATKTAFAALEQDCVLVPRTRAAKILARWRVADGLALVEELSALAVQESAEEGTWEALQIATSRSRIAIGVILDAVRSGAVAIARSDRSEGYNAFVVRAADINALADRLPKLDTEARTLTDSISAAAFGRSIGLRNAGQFLALAQTGHVQTQEILHPHTRQMQYRMSHDDITAFHNKFLTLATIETEFGLHRNTILAKLRAHGAKPFSADGQAFGMIWLRETIGVIFAKSGDS